MGRNAMRNKLRKMGITSECIIKMDGTGVIACTPAGFRIGNGQELQSKFSLDRGQELQSKFGKSGHFRGAAGSGTKGGGILREEVLKNKRKKILKQVQIARTHQNHAEVMQDLLIHHKLFGENGTHSDPKIWAGTLHIPESVQRQQVAAAGGVW
jgi:hypothetical protein